MKQKNRRRRSIYLFRFKSVTNVEFSEWLPSKKFFFIIYVRKNLPVKVGQNVFLKFSGKYSAWSILKLIYYLMTNWKKLVLQKFDKKCSCPAQFFFGQNAIQWILGLAVKIVINDTTVRDIFCGNYDDELEEF